MSDKLPPAIESAIAGLPMDDHCIDTGAAQEAEARLRGAIRAELTTTRRAALIEAAEMCEGEAKALRSVGAGSYMYEADALTDAATRLRARAEATPPDWGRDG